MRSKLTLFTLAGIVLALSITCEAAYYSNLKVTNVLIRQKGADINLRVLVHNVGGAALTNRPYQMRLLVRGSTEESFRLLKTWNEKNLKAGQVLARDYFTSAGPDDGALHEAHYEVRGEVWANGRLLHGMNSSI